MKFTLLTATCIAFFSLMSMIFQVTTDAQASEKTRTSADTQKNMEINTNTEIKTNIETGPNTETRATKEAVENLKPYPTTLEGMERYVIYLEPQEHEDILKVELIPGTTRMVDCNRHRLVGQMTEKDVSGWGFPYYTFETKGHIASTLMGCPDAKSEKFIQAESLLIRYNSRLPLVVYVQEGYELQYRIWKAGTEQQASKN